MKQLERYIVTTIVRATTLTLLVFLALLFFLELVNEMGDIEGDYQLSNVFYVVLLTMPRFVFEAFPISALIGSLLGLGTLVSHGELTAMRSLGFSLRNIMRSVLMSGLLMMAGVFIVGELVAPATELAAQEYRSALLSKQVTLKTRYGFWAKDGNAFINIRSIKAGGRLEDIYIYELTDDLQLHLATHADFAEYRNDRWSLGKIRQTLISEDGVEQRFYESATWESLLDPGLLSVIIVRPTMLPVWGLYQYIDFMRENGLSATAYQVAFWTKVSTPLATLVMLLLAVPFVLGNVRTVNVGQRVFLGAILGSIFFVLSRSFSYVALVYDISPLLAGMLPSIAFAVLAFYLMRRVY